MAGVEAGGGVEIDDGVVDGGDGLGDPGGDELELAGVGDHIAGGEDAGEAGAHRLGIDDDAVAVDGQAPGLEGAEVGGEADGDDEGLGGEGFGLAAAGLVDDHFLEPGGAADLLDLPERVEEGDGGVVELVDGVFVGAELGAVDEGGGAGDRVEGEGPVDGRVAAADDDDVLVLEGFRGADEVGDAAALEVADAGGVEAFRFEGADADAEDEGAGVVDGLVGGQAVVAGVGEPGEGEGGFAEAGDGAGGEGLFDGAADVVFGQDFGEAGDVVDVLFGVDGDELAAQFGEGVDDLGLEAAHAGVEGGEQANRSATNNRRVKNVVLFHTSRHLRTTRGASVPERHRSESGPLPGTLMSERV